MKVYDDLLGAFARQKAIKAGSRWKTLALTEGMNLHCSDLYPTIV